MERPAGWQHLELAYDPRDRTQVWLDGALVDDGAPVAEVVGRLGADGWEMVGSAAGDATQHVLWFRRPIDQPTPSADAPSADASRGAPPARVTLIGMGRNRSDPHQRRLLIDAVAALTGESGWRATRIVDKAPRVVVDGVTPQEAERVRQALVDLGAIVEVD